MSENSHAAAPREIVIEMIGVSIADLGDPQRIVLEDVNWSVASCEYWVVGGLHGSGKSNLLATLAGILPPAAGEYRLFGKSLASPAELERLAVRHRLGIVFEGGRLIHDLTIAENVALPVRYHQNLALEDVANQVQSLLELVGVDQLAGSYPNALGRNWQQRAGLARALALKPEVLLLDNVLTGLDPRHTWWWLDFLSELSVGHSMMDGRPLTLIASTDDLRPWRDRARQFAMVANRRFIGLGDQKQLAQHHEPLLQELLPAFSRPG